jgi:hypothetical protein
MKLDGSELFYTGFTETNALEYTFNIMTKHKVICLKMAPILINESVKNVKIVL